MVNIISINSFRYKREYLSEILLRVNVATDKGSGRNEMWTKQTDEIRVALKNWILVRVELMVW